jgi:hypothetical protein
MQMTIWGTNDTSCIFDAIFKAYGVEIITEYQPKYWGFQSHLEWRAARSMERHKAFFVEFLKYLDGQPNEIEAEFAQRTFVLNDAMPSINMLKALIARQFIIQDSSLANPENKIKLIVDMLIELENLGNAIQFDAEEDEIFNEERRAQRKEEDRKEPACRHIYQIDPRGMIVAVKSPEAEQLGELTAEPTSTIKC